MKKIIAICVFISLALVACGQKAQTFDKVATFNGGIQFTPTGKIYYEMPSSLVSDWNTLLNKPLVFAPDLTITNLLYKPISYVATYAGLPDKPAEIQLEVALKELPHAYPPRMTTAEIESYTAQEGDIVFDLTLKEWKGYKAGIWVTFHTNQ